MSVCTRGTCPHGRGAFIWCGDGEPYVWVHDSTNIPGHLIVCDLMEPATAEEAGEVCACGHSSDLHEATGPVPVGDSTRKRPCSCGCPDFEHRPEDIERWRETGQLSGSRYRAGETTPRPDDDDELRDRLSAGEAVPGGPGACAREGCAHLILWHERRGKSRACGKCGCPAYTTEAGQVMPLAQLELFPAGPALRPLEPGARGIPARKAPAPRVETVLVAESVL
jgi:hypothetical protein